jgi:hypothetical protein
VTNAQLIQMYRETLRIALDLAETKGLPTSGLRVIQRQLDAIPAVQVQRKEVTMRTTG